MDHPLDRFSTFFRIFAAIPILIVIGAIGGATVSTTTSDTRTHTAAAGGILVLAPLLMILFRRKYPRWWFDWNVELSRFGARVGTYLALMSDRYPSGMRSCSSPTATRHSAWSPEPPGVASVPR